jgi:tetratricopeptide (TPR) repeat protein
VTSDIRISAVLIVRNEEVFLEGCLASIADHVDEIVVVDTGSVDGTMDIARSFGVKLLERQWRHDFAWARNEGLAAASGNWILYIDADERLRVPTGASLRDNLDGSDTWCAMVWFSPTVNATPYREYRLFRNDPRLRFKGSMHETILPDLDILRQSIGASIADSPVELVHLGYEGGSEWKHQRNLPLLRAAIAENPDRLYYYYHLSFTLAALGEADEALAVSAEGLRRADRSTMASTDGAIGALIAHQHAMLLHERGDDALPAIATGFRHYPRNPSLQLLEARILIDHGRFSDALPILDELAHTDSATYRDRRVAHDRRIFDLHAHDLKGVALLRLGRRAEAAESFRLAALAAPDELSYRVKAQALGAQL